MVDADDQVMLHGDVGFHNLALDPKTGAVNGLFDYDGAAWADKKLVTGFAALKDDGSTACGCWIYSGVYPEEGKNLAAAREGDDRRHVADSGRTQRFASGLPGRRVRR